MQPREIHDAWEVIGRGFAELAGSDGTLEQLRGLYDGYLSVNIDYSFTFHN